MARETEELLIALRADLNQFEKGFAKAHGISVGQMRRIQREVEGSANKIERRMAAMGASIKGSLLAAFTVGGFTALISQLDDAIKRIADLQEAAESAGVSVEQLEKLTFAGAAAGLSQDKIVSGLQRLNKELAKAKAEGKEVGTTFDEFLRLADNVAAAGTAVEKTGLATEKLGKSGAQYLPLLNQGSAELTRQFGEAALAGGRLGKAADEFYDKWQQGLTNWQKSFDTTIASILVSLDIFSTRMTDRTKAQLEFRRAEILTSLSKIKFDIFANAPGGSNELRAELEDIEERLRLLSRIPKPPLLQTGSGEGDTEPEPAAETAGKIADRLGELETVIEKTPDAGLEALNAQLKEMRDALVEIEQIGVDAFFSWIDDTQSAKEALADLAKQLAKLAFQAALFGQGPFATLTGGQNSGLLSMLNSFLLPARASGGHVNAGQPYMVGERGPEPFIPSQSGRILPSRSMGVGAAPIINITNMPGVQSSQTSRSSGGRAIIDVVNRVVEGRFPELLNLNAPLIGGRPASKRTS